MFKMFMQDCIKPTLYSSTPLLYELFCGVLKAIPISQNIIKANYFHTSAFLPFQVPAVLLPYFKSQNGILRKFLQKLLIHRLSLANFDMAWTFWQTWPELFDKRIEPLN